MLYFYQLLASKINVKNKRKRVSRICENAYLSIKNPKASRALKRALDPSRRMLASLAQLHFATSATFRLRSWGPPLTKSWIRTCNDHYFIKCTPYQFISVLQSKILLSVVSVESPLFSKIGFACDLV